jgi:hypothetical protein
MPSPKKTPQFLKREDRVPDVRFEDYSFTVDPIAKGLEELKARWKDCEDFQSAARACEKTREVWLAFSDTWCLTGGACRNHTTPIVKAFAETVSVVKKVMPSISRKDAKILGQFIANINHRTLLVKTLYEGGEAALLAKLQKGA